MEVNTFNIQGPIEFIPKIHYDDRGSFAETWNEEAYSKLKFNEKFVQDNQSISKMNVFRGIHLQYGEYAQGKLVRVVKGKAIDFIVDLRFNSSTFGEYLEVSLDEHKGNLLWVPPGFGHGFLSLEDETIFSYKCTKPYNKESEVCIKFNDVDINIKSLNYLKNNLIISHKDLNGITLKEYKDKFS